MSITSDVDLPNHRCLNLLPSLGLQVFAFFYCLTTLQAVFGVAFGKRVFELFDQYYKQQTALEIFLSKMQPFENEAARLK